jgi:hypothetical protein
METDLQVLREKLPPKVRLQMALKRSRAHYKGVSPREIAKAASAAVQAVRRDAGRHA